MEVTTTRSLVMEVKTTRSLVMEATTTRSLVMVVPPQHLQTRSLA